MTLQVYVMVLLMVVVGIEDFGHRLCCRVFEERLNSTSRFCYGADGGGGHFGHRLCCRVFEERSNGTSSLCYGPADGDGH